MLVVLDDVWQKKAAREFMHLVPNGVFIITTRLKDVGLMLGDPELVPELDSETGLRLLTDIAPKAVAFDAEGASNLVSAVYGLPLALVLIGKYLRRESADGDPDRMASAFQIVAEAGQRLELNPSEEDGSRSLAEIIEISFTALRSDEARRALLALSIFRPKPDTFSKEIALRVAEAEPAVLYDLSDIGLIEHYGQGEYTMHRVIAEYARTKLPLTESQNLHHKALDYYSRKLQQDIDDNPVAYLGWYRYEQTDWQATKDAWLYHLAHTGNAVTGVLAFLRVYFDAFWWWGYYQRFPFC
ncbi:MAG: NB-ARC domain-containing protein, partial [Betaproteobacteria bacterium HGW-Betaproteobacteria-21]